MAGYFCMAGLTQNLYSQNTDYKTSGSKKVLHTIYTVGGVGNLKKPNTNELLAQLKLELANSPASASLLYLGDNISEEEDDWKTDLEYLKLQLNIIRDFKGQTFFLPGNNEWMAYNALKVERLQDHVKDLDKDLVTFLPKNACPLEHRVINENLDIIFIDSKWFISNWSRLNNINFKCTDIVTRRRFVEVLEGYINDSQGKNLLIAMHHPVFSNGKYAGQTILKDHLLPLPVLGTIWSEFKNLGAFDPDYLNAYKYQFLRVVVTALAKNSKRITIVSAHENSLQFLEGEGITQIITGTVSETAPVHLTKDIISAPGGTLSYKGHFGIAAPGYSKIRYYDDGSHDVEFTFMDKGVIKTHKSSLSAKDVVSEPQKFIKLNKSFKNTSIYKKEDTERTGAHKFLWGQRYRKYYGENIKVPVAYLDTLYGGLSVVKKGGGHQSNTLRLKDTSDRQYNMRSLKKNALRFLRFKLPGFTFDQKDFEDTWVQDVVKDFFSSAHPYMQVVVNPLAQAAKVNHSDVDLFYIPKQKALEPFNDLYGDELYYIERRPSDEQEQYPGYQRMFKEKGSIEDFESTTDMLEKLKEDESYVVDDEAYIRARVFDMWIGDWDRHHDQWRWMEYEKDNEKLFVPIPRDRDNSFPKFDGAFLKAFKLFIPSVRPWQTFDKEIKNLKWLNIYGMPLDKALTSKKEAREWREIAKKIADSITADDIEAAFKKLPPEFIDSTSHRIKEYLKIRLNKLPQWAYEYGQYLNKIVSVKGTHKDDQFIITRNEDGTTTITGKRLLKDKPDPIFYKRTFYPEQTREIHVYGLNDKDEFEVRGSGKSEIKVRLIGGYGEDSYKIKNAKRTKVYDWKHEKTILEGEKPKTLFTNQYKVNTYHWRYHKPNTNVLLPLAGFRTDDGIFFGASNVYTKRGINGNPFRERHTLGARYYTGFQAFQIDYKAIFGNVFPDWNLEFEAFYTSDRYARNFFGLGNNSVNLEDNLDIDFYRARLRQFRLTSGLTFQSLKVKLLYESFQVTENENRLFNTDNFNESIFENQQFLGTEMSVRYDIDDSGDFPTRALRMELNAGYKFNTEISNNRFGYVGLSLGFDRKLIPSGNVVVSSDLAWRTNFGGDYFFYQAPSIGGNNGLRGFRDERFTGDSYFYQTTDVKLRLKRFITSVAPVNLGIYGGFDYGRVWQSGENSGRWHTSQGIGVWLGTLGAISLQAGWFNSVENNLIQIGFGLSF